MPDPTTPEGRTELRQMLTLAHGGGWISEAPEDIHGPGAEGWDYAYISTSEGAEDDDPPIASFDQPAFRDLATAAVNALPALLDALDEAEAAIARVRALAYSTAVGYSEEERILDALDGDS